MEKKLVLCDTNILIEMYRNNGSIIATLQNIGEENIAISAVTAGELLYGAINKRELQIIKKDIDRLHLIHIDKLISAKSLELLFHYSKSHGLSLPDAIIASTSLIMSLPLYTLNTKDFKFITNLMLWSA